MAPPIYPQDPFRETYYYPVILNGDVKNAQSLGIESNVPIAIIGLQATSPLASGTGFLNSDGNSTHQDIKLFLSVSGVGTQPPTNFGFNYLSSFAFSSFIDNDVRTALLSGTYGKRITIKEVSGKGQPSRVESLEDTKYPYRGSIYYYTNKVNSILTIGGNYKIFNNNISKKIVYDFILNYNVNDIKNYSLKYESPKVSGTEYHDSSGNFLSSTIPPEDKPMTQQISLSYNDIESENGVRVVNGNVDIGNILLQDQYITVTQSDDIKVILDGYLPIQASSTILKCKAKVKGEYDLVNGTLIPETGIYFSANKSVDVASGNLDYVTSVSSLNVPRIKLTDKGSNLQKQFALLMVQFYAESSKDSTLKLADYINTELAKKSDLHRAIIIDLISNCKTT
jgi:hypothetical protein